MPESPILYYITSRAAFFGDERTRRHRLLDKIAEAASQGIDYIQIREKDMPTRELESLAHEAMQIIRGQLATGNRQPGTALLINTRTDIALATQAAGVHLPANNVSRKKSELHGNVGKARVARALLPAKSRHEIC